MTTTTTLEAIRKGSLWTAIVSAVALLALLVLWAWGAFNLIHEDAINRYLYSNSPSECYSSHVGSGLPVTAWGSVTMTFAALAFTSIAILVALYASKRASRAN